MDISTAVRPVAGSPRWMREAAGWLAFISALMLLALAVPAARFDPGSGQFLLFIGAIGIWRYSLGILHFLRGMLFLYWVFPRLRRKASALGETAMPSRVYLMITSFHFRRPPPVACRPRSWPRWWNWVTSNWCAVSGAGCRCRMTAI